MKKDDCAVTHTHSHIEKTHTLSLTHSHTLSHSHHTGTHTTQAYTLHRQCPVLYCPVPAEREVWRPVVLGSAFGRQDPLERCRHQSECRTPRGRGRGGGGERGVRERERDREREKVVGEGEGGFEGGVGVREGRRKERARKEGEK